ncbi:MAG: HRDC domain-containing protein [bacterium]
MRQLWHWREHEAQRADLPPFKIMGHQKILDLAIWAASHPKGSLMHGPKLPCHCTGRRFEALEKAIRKAKNTPESRWPKSRKRPRSTEIKPDLRPQIEALRTECSRVANVPSIRRPSPGGD